MDYVLIALGIAVVVMNIVTYALYAIDKRRAEKKQWRISEFTLFLCAFLMGGLGALLGMKVLRHKTQHTSFKVLVPLALVFNIAVIAAVVFFVVL